MRVRILRVDGAREEHELDPSTLLADVERLLRARFLDRVSLGFPHWLLIDQQRRGLVNLHASQLAGYSIRGDAALINEVEFRP